MKLSIAIRLAIGAAVLGIAANGGQVTQAQSPDSEKIAQLFQDIKHHAVEAEYDAELLESYTRSGTAWQAHATRVSQMRSHINDLGRDFTEASKLRAEGSEWQKEAIDQIEPVLKGMADHLSAAIDHLNANQGKTRMPPWTDYVKGNREYATKAANLIRDYVDYGEARARTEALEKRLGTPAPPDQD